MPLFDSEILTTTISTQLNYCCLNWWCGLQLTMSHGASLHGPSPYWIFMVGNHSSMPYFWSTSGTDFQRGDITYRTMIFVWPADAINVWARLQFWREVQGCPISVEVPGRESHCREVTIQPRGRCITFVIMSFILKKLVSIHSEALFDIVYWISKKSWGFKD